MRCLWMVRSRYGIEIERREREERGRRREKREERDGGTGEREEGSRADKQAIDRKSTRLNSSHWE